MIAVYCAKLSEPVVEALPGWVTSLLGAVIGAIITGVIAFYLQRNSHRNALVLERNKRKSEFVNKFVSDKVFVFLDQEIDFLQQLSGSSTIVYAKDLGFEHRSSMAMMQALVSVIDDGGEIKNSFNDLMQIKTSMEKNIINNSGRDNFKLLGDAIKLCAKIKLLISNLD
ncbi:hypothetical protein KD288_002423 [Salmonella enterica]|nr:hypothetical protein [Salmonella enterica]